MPAPMTHYGRRVTGRARFRKRVQPSKILSLASDFHQLVLEVEVESERLDSAMGDPTTHWIDAVEGDLYPLRYHRKRKGLEPLI
jgi:hypothetical protein